MKYLHREHIITVDKRGTFKAEGGNISARSLEAVKRKLDEKYNAKPFTAIRVRWYDPAKLERVTVVGMHRFTRWGSARTDFVLKDGNRTETLYEDTPENWRLLRAHVKLRAKNKRIRAQLDHEEKAALGEATKAKSE